MFREDIDDVGDLYLDVAEAYMDCEIYTEARDVLAKLVCSQKYNMVSKWIDTRNMNQKYNMVRKLRKGKDVRKCPLRLCILKCRIEMHSELPKIF